VGVSVEEKGQIDLGDIPLTEEIHADGKTFAYSQGFYSVTLTGTETEFTFFTPVSLIDTNYDVVSYGWDINGDKQVDTITTSPRITIAKQSNWTGGTFALYGFIKAIHKKNRTEVSSEAGAITFVVTAKKVADAELSLGTTSITAGDTIPDTIGIYIKDVASPADLMHIELTNATVASAKLAVPATGIQMFPDSNVIDIIVMPGGKKLTAGSTPVKIADVVLAGLVAGKTVSVSVVLQADGVNIPFESVGTVVVK